VGRPKSAAAVLAVLACLIVGAVQRAGATGGETFVVTTTADSADANPGDGVCADASSACSLRAAVMEADTFNGSTVITLPAGTYTLSQGELQVTKNIVIDGAGARSTIVDQAATARVFEVDSGSTSLITGITITGGSADIGGGVRVFGTLGLTDVTITGNTASTSGGGIDLNGTVTITDSTVAHNSSPGGGFGGGIDDFGQALVITNSTIADNSSGTNAGGILAASTTSLLNDTIVGNTAGNSTGGGSLYVYGGAPVGAINSIFDSPVGGGGECSGGTLSAQSLNDITSDATCGTVTHGAIADPQLGTLQNNGGSTDTFLPNASSPAVDAGNDAACPAIDQRGVIRPQGPHCDIGAVELAASSPPPPPPPPATADAAQSSVQASPGTVPADGTTASTVTVTLRDTGGNPVAGKTVTLTPTGGSFSTVSASTTTNAGGQATFTVTDATAETVGYVADDTSDGVIVTPTASVVFQPTATVYVVDTATGSTAGAGHYTLASAIVAANAHAGADTITFKPGLGTVTIGSGGLPAITDALTIDGCSPAAETSGGCQAVDSHLVASGNGVFDVASANVTIEGLNVDDSHSTAFALPVVDDESGASGLTLEYDTLAAPASATVQVIVSAASGLTLGTLDGSGQPVGGNTISGGAFGVRLDEGSGNALIAGNTIDLAAAGIGVYVDGADVAHVRLLGNDFSGHGGDAVSLLDGSDIEIGDSTLTAPPNSIAGFDFGVNVHSEVSAFFYDNVGTVGSVFYDVDPFAPGSQLVYPPSLATPSTIEGIAPAGDLVEVVSTENNQTLNGVVGTAVAASDGSWNVTPTTSLAVGSHVSVVDTIPGGGSSDLSSPEIVQADSSFFLYPQVLSNPEISGSPQVGQTLTSSTGVWGGSPSTFDYQWIHCTSTIISGTCTNVGTDSSSYTPTSADLGDYIAVTVTATNSTGPTHTASNYTDAVQASGTPIPTAAPPAPTVTSPGDGNAVPETGPTFTVSSPGTWTNSPTSYQYEWYSCATTATSSCFSIILGSASFSPRPSSVEAGERFAVAVVATNAAGTSAIGPIGTPSAPVGDFPFASTAPSITGTLSVGQTLTANPGVWSGSPTSYTYAWSDCTGICTALGITSSTLALTSPYAGHSLTVTVTAANAWWKGLPTQSAKVTVGLTAPTISTIPTISGNAAVGSGLTATSGTWLGNASTYAFQWLRCNLSFDVNDSSSCVNIPGATSANYTPVGGDVGHTLRVSVIASNTGGSSSPSLSLGGGNDLVFPASGKAPPVNVGAPVISGTAAQGRTLTASDNIWLAGDPDVFNADPGSYAFVWKRCDTNGANCVTISGATQMTYVPVSADVGHTLVVAETAANSAGTSTPAVSAATATIGPLTVPQSIGTPAILGNPVSGSQQLAETVDRWEPTPTSFTYLWLRCDANGNKCNAIGGATGANYTATNADIGSTLRVNVTASDSVGAGTVVTSPQSAVIAMQAPGNTALPAITGAAEQGETLTATPGTWTGSPTSYSYSWSMCITLSGHTSPTCFANFVTGQTLALTGQAYAFATLTVTVTATNAGGSTKATSAASASVTNDWSVHTPTATSVAASSATLGATVSSPITTGSAYVEWGTSASYGLKSTAVAVQGNDFAAPVPVSFNVSGLHTGTTYHYSVVVTDALGVSHQTADATFQTTGQASTLVPVAKFTATPFARTDSLEVAFDGSGSNEPQGSISLWSWDFGDGSSGGGEATTHTYGAPGSYLVTLRVVDAGGAIATSRSFVTVPASAASAQTIADKGGTVTLGSGASAAVVAWQASSFPASVTVSLAPVTSGLSNPGAFTLQLSVTGANGKPITTFDAPVEVTFPKPPPGLVPSYSLNGISWTAMPQLKSPSLPAGYKDGWYRDSTGTIHIFTLHATYYGLLNGSTPATRELAAQITVPSVIQAGSKHLDVSIDPTLSGRATLIWRAGGRILARAGGALKASSARHFALAVPRSLGSTTTLDVAVNARGERWTRTVTVRVTGRH
jgi:CSLREA domain-containing protein